MTDHQQPEALDRAGDAEMLADEGDLIHLQSWQYVQKVLRASAADRSGALTGPTTYQV